MANSSRRSPSATSADWFQAHKAEFEEGWDVADEQRSSSTFSELDRFGAVSPTCDLDEPKVFRIFRDVRFSKDKSPYKTHIGGDIPVKRNGKEDDDRPIALYFHVGATETVAAAGHYVMETESLARFRAAVADDKRGKELTKILGSLLSKKGFATRMRTTGRSACRRASRPTILVRSSSRPRG